MATVNMAVRLWCTGDSDSYILRGHFDVRCVDEAGHATEPEIIAVTATLMRYHKDDGNTNISSGQIILAGNPQQLGPVITSELCKKFQMDQSYMERLLKTSSPYK